MIKQKEKNIYNRPFHRYGGHIEFIRFKEYYGMPRGHLLSIYVNFSGKKRTSLYISREKGDHSYIQTQHNDLFFPLQSFLGKLKEKSARKARVNTEQVPPGHPIILLKSNKFNMAAVSVKGSIGWFKNLCGAWTTEKVLAWYFEQNRRWTPTKHL